MVLGFFFFANCLPHGVSFSKIIYALTFIFLWGEMMSFVVKIYLALMVYGLIATCADRLKDV